MPVAGGSRTVLKRYDNSLFSARSLTVYDNDVYFVEGTWLGKYFDRDGVEYPTFEDAGHLNRIVGGELEDLGPVWRSFRSDDGRGEHTAFVSNLYHIPGDPNIVDDKGRFIVFLVMGCYREKMT